MMDHKTTIQELKLKVKKFCEDRDWDQFHNAKELAIALSLESAEVLDLFRYKSTEEVEKMLKNPEKKLELSEELADVLYLVFRISQLYDIDLSSQFNKKMAKNELKYPVELAKGKNNKYTELKKEISFGKIWSKYSKSLPIYNDSLELLLL